MKITTGTRLGPYEIVAPIGAGGMGEVFKARDTRLERSVAIKILPAELAHNAQFKLRFEREAKTISQLNHPHICTLHDVGEVDGTSYLVMELLEGESLADRLARGPVPISEVLRYGAQIADALDRAHRAGITHRDLKPGNVMITKSGAKLLDFGLAKSEAIIRTRSAPPEPSNATDEATAYKPQPPLTQEGTILGTFQYMAPEQLEGQEADARTDIFAFGAMLYEMATGKRAFEGKTKTSLIAAIVKDQPRPISELQPLTPRAFEHVVAKCLSKDPEDRWQNAHDVAEELRWIGEAGSQTAGSATKRPHGNLVAAAAVAGWLVAVAVMVLTATYASKLRDRSRVTRTEIAVSLETVQIAPVALSPDGRRVVGIITTDPAERLVTSSGSTSGVLWVRDLSNDEGRILPGTEGAAFPFWSPDGHSVGFFAAGKLKSISIDSGAIQTLGDAPDGRGGAWSSRGVIVFAPNIASPLMKIPENGGPAVAVTKLRGIRWTHRNPTFLRDGTRFLYCSAESANTTLGELRAASIDGNIDQKVLDYASNAAVVDDWILTVRDRNVVAQRFDADSLEVRGRPLALAQNVDWYLPRYQGVFSAAGDTLVYRRKPLPRMHFLRLDRDGARAVEFREEGYYSFPHVSADGRRVSVNRFDPSTNSSDLWLFDLEKSTSLRLTHSRAGTMEDAGVFSPDGQRIAISASGAALGISGEAWLQPVGGGTRDLLSRNAEYLNLSEWSRDGRMLVATRQRSTTGTDIEAVPLAGDRKPVTIVGGVANQESGRISPNGRWLAYQSDESGRAEIYVTNFPDASAKWQVSTEGGQSPNWSADGRQILFLYSSRVFVANVREGESFAVDASRHLEALGDRIAGFNLAANGTIVALRTIDDGDAPLSVVLNWRELLEGR